MFGRVGANEAAVIIDYGQKVEPTGQIESQSECFGKAGISQFGATFLMPSERCQPRLATLACVSTRLYCVAVRKISEYQDSASPNRWCW